MFFNGYRWESMTDLNLRVQDAERLKSGTNSLLKELCVFYNDS